MSKEREDKFQDLATYGVSFFKRGQRIDPRDVYISTEPEQEHVGIVRIIGGYPDNSERVVDWVRPYKYLKDGDRLYLAPQTHKPLSDGEIRDGLDGKNGFENWYDDRFVDGVRFAEKAHGIGGGE